MSDTCFDSSLIMVFLICWLISFPMHSAATKRQMPPAVCKPTPMAERIRFFFMLFMFLSVLFVRVDVLLHLFISDIPHLLEIFEAEVEAELTEADIVDFKKKINTVFDATICRRLMAVGLLYQLHPVSFGFSMDNFFVTSRTGKYFCGLIQRCIEKKS